MLIHLWVPALDPTAGGVQVYSAHLRNALTQLGHRCEVVSHDGKRSAFIAKALSKALLGSPDLIISTHLNFSPLAHLVKKLRRVPYAISLHGIEAWMIPNPSIRRALRAATALLPVSEFTARQFRKAMDSPLPPLELLSNTVDSDRFNIGDTTQIRQRHGIEADAPLILTIGRMASSEAYKGHDTVIRALPQVLARYPKAVYLIVGNGDDRSRLERLTATLDLTTQVHFVGEVAYSDLPAYYQSCDVFTMPSRGEGFGIVYLEAMACGKPVIAGNLDGGIDALDGGRLGTLVAPDQPEEVAAALIACLEKAPSERLSFPPSALRVEMLKLFGPEAFQKRLAQILQSIHPCAA